MSYPDDHDSYLMAQLEERAYHAYREWPLYLKLRLRYLKQHLPREAFSREKQVDDATSLLEDYGFSNAKDEETLITD
jgi:hypothetical protein